MNDQQQNNPKRPGQREGIDENLNTSGVYLSDSTLQSGSEFQQDKNSDHTKEDNIVITSGVDDLQSNSDDSAGADRGRETYGDVELNKGLEAQAKDDES